jgi:hypothetical protein
MIAAAFPRVQFFGYGCYYGDRSRLNRPSHRGRAPLWSKNLPLVQGASSLILAGLQHWLYFLHSNRYLGFSATFDEKDSVTWAEDMAIPRPACYFAPAHWDEFCLAASALGECLHYK